MERFEQMIHMPEQINKRGSQFENIRNDPKLWHGVHVSRASIVRGDQLIDHPEH